MLLFYYTYIEVHVCSTHPHNNNNQKTGTNFTSISETVGGERPLKIKRIPLAYPVLMMIQWHVREQRSKWSLCYIHLKLTAGHWTSPRG